MYSFALINAIILPPQGNTLAFYICIVLRLFSSVKLMFSVVSIFFDDFKIKELSNDEVEIYSVAFHPPTFPGGDAQILKFFLQNFQYPKIYEDAQIQGKVILRFVVKANGEIGKVEIIRSVDPPFDREAIRVARLLPTFIPARNALGENVDCWYILPICIKATALP